MWRSSFRTCSPSLSFSRSVGWEATRFGQVAAQTSVLSVSAAASVWQMRTKTDVAFPPLDTFVRRHIGSSDDKVQEMLATLGLPSLDALVDKTVPKNIRRPPLDLETEKDKGAPKGEEEVLRELKEAVSKNKLLRSFIGMGYYGTLLPSVIRRCMLENPGWYTPYTPYQAEISQGRLQSLLNFQTMIADITGLPISNASLLDEATAAAEAVSMCVAASKTKGPKRFFVSDDVHPQTLAVVRTRAQALGIEIIVGDPKSFDFAGTQVTGALVQHPTTDGRVVDYGDFIKRAHENKALVVMGSDLLALTLLRSPGELGADIAYGSAQRFGVPMGFGGPHAAFLSCKDEYKRLLAGRIVGVSKDVHGNPAIRMALQTREQHIRREKATSNICTSQVLLANISAMYAVYHGPQGLTNIATRVHDIARTLAEGLSRLGYQTNKDTAFFDTVRIDGLGGKADDVLAVAVSKGVNLRKIDDDTIGISMDETVTDEDVSTLFEIFSQAQTDKSKQATLSVKEVYSQLGADPMQRFKRTSKFLQHPVFNKYHTEHELLRYMYRLQSKDLGLNTSMIPLGSCTMKLNAATEMYPITWPEISSLHPFVPQDQVEGTLAVHRELERYLAKIGGFHAASLQPNAGSQGEFAGLLCIKKYLQRQGQGQRKVCLIPTSAHGTNPASAVMAGMDVVIVACDKEGNVDLQDLKAKTEKHKNDLAAFMITYPSTHGVFEESIAEICKIVHDAGGQVYMDGANMNAQVGITSPGQCGADVCHFNLHKTFCIPHGGGGPGVGAIAVAKHLVPHLPNSEVVQMGGSDSIGSIAAAPWGSSAIMPIPYLYIKMMGSQGLKKATQVAILNANYMATRLAPHYPVLYKGKQGMVGHEFILDIRPFKASTGVEAEDIAKRLMDYGYHAPTLSFPIPNTLMVEPTESESKEELDRFCDALISIRGEIKEIEEGKADKVNNVLQNAPHTEHIVTSDKWDRPYSREKAAFPAPWLRVHKHWPAVGRVEGAYGDKNLICSCPPTDSYASL